jgi:hypothetical protein
MGDTSLPQPFVILGLLCIILGILFLLLPFLARFVPSMENIPPILLWVYKREGFIFATSPILIIISIIMVFLFLLRTR